MASQIRIVHHGDAVRRMLRGEGEFSSVAELIDKAGKSIAEAAGEGMTYESSVGKNRYRGNVFTETIEAKRGEAVDRRLTRAIDAGRG